MCTLILEYHEELLPDAKQEFFVAAQEVLDTLPEADQQEIHELREQKMLAKEQALKDAAADVEKGAAGEEEKSSSELLITEDSPEGIELNPDSERGEMPAVKESEVKKMFRRIASVTHPDKVGKDVSRAQRHKLDKIFKKAKDAYTKWKLVYFILYIS